MVHESQRQLVQEVAAGGLPELPSRYVLKEEDRPKDAVTAFGRLVFPTVDVRRLAEPEDVEEAAKLRSALESWGLFVVTGHGMPEALLDDILGSTREFFYLPQEEKLKYSNVVDGDKFQLEGYGIDRVDTDEQVLDWSDRLYLQVQPEDERRMQFWPSHPAPLKTLLHDFTVKSEQVAQLLLRATARALGFKEEFFADRVGERVTTFARFNYYPPCPRPDLVNGVKPHADNSLFTILLLDKDVGGLQVHKDGVWVDVPMLGNDLLVLVGDEMEMMSNAVFKASMHRVVTSEKERVSLVLFFLPDQQKEVKPAEELVDEKRPVMYKNHKAKTFSDGFWDAFALGERAIDFLKLRVEQEAASTT
ncbi:hypothetical protein EJB05_22338, partial [Eragrostis curvula]